jgi:hypothetical protein
VKTTVSPILHFAVEILAGLKPRKAVKGSERRNSGARGAEWRAVVAHLV